MHFVTIVSTDPNADTAPDDAASMFNSGPTADMELHATVRT